MSIDRKHLIEQLIDYELRYLIDNNDKHTLQELVDFFTNGGFHNYTDEQLSKKYDLTIAEDFDVNNN